MLSGIFGILQLSYVTNYVTNYECALFVCLLCHANHTRCLLVKWAAQLLIALRAVGPHRGSKNIGTDNVIGVDDQLWYVGLPQVYAQNPSILLY